MSELLTKSPDAQPFSGASAEAFDLSFGIAKPRQVGAKTSWIATNLRDWTAAFMRVADCVLVVIAGVLAQLIRATNADVSNIYIIEIILTVLLTIILFQHAGLYKISKLTKISFQIPRIMLAFGAASATLIILDYFLKISSEISRIWSLLWFGFALTLLILMRVAVCLAIGRLYHGGKFASPIAIIGSRDAIQWLIAEISSEIGKTVDLVGAFDVDRDKFQVFQQLVEVSKTNCIDEVLIPLPWKSAIPLETLLRPLRNLPIAVRLIPEVPKTTFACLSFSEQCGLPAISVLERPLNGWQTNIKRAEDLVISSLALLAAAPIMLTIALLIKLDSPGPALFRQDRWGFNARKISVLKFRTMRIDTGDDPFVTQATRNDARVTRIGRILRRTSLDELPQLLNVLHGDMSLVGPRPHAVAHNERYISLIDNYLGRHRVKPGITGLAQINGCRGITDTIDKMQMRVTYDLRYIDCWSLFLDIKIIFMTFFLGFTNKNAF